MSVTSAPVLTPIIKVGGSRLSVESEATMLEARVLLELNAPAQASVRFQEGTLGDPNASIVIGATLEVLSADGDTTLFKGKVTATTVTAEGGRLPELTVVAHDVAWEMARATRANNVKDATVGSLLGDLAASYGLTVASSVQGNYEWAPLVDTDLALLEELCRRVGADWWVTPDDTLHVATPDAIGPTVEVTYGSDLRDFTVRFTGDAPSDVTLNAWDPVNKQIVTGQATTPTSGVEPTFDGTAPPKPFAKSLMTTGLGRPWSAGEATTMSQAVLDRVVSGRTVARGTCEGYVGIAVGGTVQVAMAGSRINGTYPVTGVEHLVRAGRSLTTRFNAGDRSSHSLAVALGGRAVTPGWRHDGVVLGVVEANNDDQNLGRVKVRLPTVGLLTGWARVLTQGGGASRGSFFHPEVGDEVLVGFEGGDLRQPVVLGGLHSKTDQYLPVTFSGDGKVTERTIKTRKGHVLTFTEGEDASDAAILMQLSGGQQLIKVTGQGTSITTAANQPITITAGQDKITMDAVGTITLQAQTKIVLKAGTEIDLQAATISIKADAQLSAEAATTSVKGNGTLALQGGGSASLKGAVVQIN